MAMKAMASERERDVVALQGGQGGGDGGDARGHRHGHREDVVDEQRGSRGLGRGLAQVLLGDDVGAAAARVFDDGLAVAEGEDHQQEVMPRATGTESPKIRRGRGPRRRAAPAVAQGRGQGGHDLLGGVGHRGERVGGEDRQGDRVADLGVFGLVAGQTAAE